MDGGDSMTTTTEMISAYEDQVLESVRQSQEAVVKAVGTWAEAGKNLIPELPSLPFADQIPAASEMVEHYFGFADKLLAVQKEYASAVLQAAQPVLGTNGTTSPARRPSAPTTYKRAS
jgi:hypothetical protein